jgi:hypothetical protein
MASTDPAAVAARELGDVSAEVARRTWMIHLRPALRSEASAMQ